MLSSFIRLSKVFVFFPIGEKAVVNHPKFLHPTLGAVLG